MLKKEAAKLKAKVQEASLAAAKAAEEAEQKLDEMVEKVMVETDATREEVENIVSNLYQKKRIHIKTIDYYFKCGIYVIDFIYIID